ncbi:MAG TPA: hypothetical protein VF988_05415, partial [Verrucomicrobiae bacterium]
MQRPAQQSGRGRLFHDLPGVHDRHAVRQVTDNAQIVCDQQNRHAEPLLEVAQQVQDLRLDGHVQGGGGFIR